MLNSRVCPKNGTDTAESYCLGWLSVEEAAEFEEHYIGCTSCAALVAEAYQYTAAMKTAARQFEGEFATLGARR